MGAQTESPSTASTASTATRGAVGWWGPVPLELDERAFARVGPLALGLERREHEWRLWHAHGDDPVDQRMELEVPSERETPTGATSARFGFRHSPHAAALEPMLADRSVVLRPETPLYVPSGETVQIFASTPVFVRVHFAEGHASRDKSAELILPTHLMSDTWFGADTTDGELCYASRTNAQLSAEQVDIRAHRAVTEITVQNRASETLQVERLKLPVEHLSVFSGRDSSLWTEAVRFERTDDNGHASISVGDRPPETAGEVTHLSGARKDERTVVLRVFDALLSRERSWMG